MNNKKIFSTVFSVIGVGALLFSAIPTFANTSNPVQDPTASWYVTEDALPHGKTMHAEKMAVPVVEISSEQDLISSWYVTEDRLPKAKTHMKGIISPKRYSGNQETTTETILDLRSWYVTEDRLPRIQ